MPFLAMKATVCMTNVITKPSRIFYTSREAGVMKLGSFKSVENKGYPLKKGNSDPIQK
jgi:hypothetical protein